MGLDVMVALDVIVQVVLFALLIVAAYTDIIAGKVYNWCTFPALFLGLALNYLIGGRSEGHANLYQSLFGMALGFGFYVTFYMLRLVGGGDLKLVTAIGALKGWKFLMYAILYTSIAGGILGVLVLLWSSQLLAGTRATLRMAFRVTRRGMTEQELEETAPARIPIRYGVAIAVGTMWASFVGVH